MPRRVAGRRPGGNGAHGRRMFHRSVCAKCGMDPGCSVDASVFDRVRQKQARIIHPMEDPSENPEMLDEYDFSAVQRGKYAERYSQGSNVVVLSPDVAKSFPDSESVNRARGRRR